MAICLKVGLPTNPSCERRIVYKLVRTANHYANMIESRDVLTPNRLADGYTVVLNCQAAIASLVSTPDLLTVYSLSSFRSL